MALYNSKTYSSHLNVPPKRLPFQDSYQAASVVSGEIKALWVSHLIQCYTRKIAG